jgi:hypothetical protein
VEARVPARLSVAEGRKFGLLVGGVFLLFAGISYWRGHVIAPRVLAGLGGLLVLGGALMPGQMGPVYNFWMGIAKVLSKVTTPLFMGIVYFLVLTPMAVLRRKFGGNPMRHEPVNDSYWTPHTVSSEAKSMERQF